jgi:ferredoxin-thioredoxin reductase catalytic subunit
METIGHILLSFIDSWGYMGIDVRRLDQKVYSKYVKRWVCPCRYMTDRIGTDIAGDISRL